MAQQWMGFTISIDCGPMGVFQGVVTAVEAEPQSVTLSRVFHNGVPHTSPSIVISALDIKDLTIIAAPQAQLDPVVELKKPIPTRPGRLIGGGAQNFHSQPAPPRALHLNVEELDPQKAAVLLDYHKRVQQDAKGPRQTNVSQPAAPRTVSSPPAKSQTATSNQACFFPTSEQPQKSPSTVGLSALQAALPDALRISVASQAAALASSPAVRQITSQRTSQPNSEGVSTRMQSLSIASTVPTHGGFKMTSALSARSLNTKQSSPPEASSASSDLQLNAAGLLQAKSISGNSEGATYSAKIVQASSSRPFNFNTTVQALPHSRSKPVEVRTQSNDAFPHPQRSTAQAFFQGAAALIPPQCQTGRSQRDAPQAASQGGAAALSSLLQASQQSMGLAQVSPNGAGLSHATFGGGLVKVSPRSAGVAHAHAPSQSAGPVQPSLGTGLSQAPLHHGAGARLMPHGMAAQVSQMNTDGYASGSGDGNRTPNKRDRQRQRWQAKDEACFGSPTNNGFDQEFDFEKNLALFDKQAVYDEIAIQRPDLVQAANGQRRQQNYRHDQNIIVNNRRIPTIIVPNPGSAEYVTDDGLVIPSMRPELLQQLHQKAHDVGFSFDRQSELLARCATEMSLQLLGGAHRLNPHNAHQWPTVIVMVGPHRQGSTGVMCARQLECQGISTVTLVVNEAAAPTIMKRELNLYKCGGAPIVSSTDDLPDNVDLVIMALAGHLQADVANSLEYGKAASWASNKRASVLALDPPPVGTPGIITKFALAPTLPLTYSPQNGKIYLCNLGVPIVVFKEMGIRYRSPFGSKFVIPLHPNDE